MRHTRMPAPGSLLAVLAVTLAAAIAALGPRAEAQASGPSLLDPKLSVRTVASGLVTPTTMAFLGPDDMLVLEKQTGKVQRVTGGTMQTVLDLAVNNASERGLLGIALHPDFETNRAVYLYWSCASTHPVDPFVPSERECPDTPPTGPSDRGNRTTSSAARSPTTRTSPASSSASTTTAELPKTTPSSGRESAWAARWGPTSRRSSRTECATASASPSTRSRDDCG